MNQQALNEKYTWFFSPCGDRLHFIPGSVADEDFWENACSADESTTAPAVCGIVAEWVAPGIFSRMGMPRCKRCCSKTGIPDGDGTPSNFKDEILSSGSPR